MLNKYRKNIAESPPLKGAFLGGAPLFPVILLLNIDTELLTLGSNLELIIAIAFAVIGSLLFGSIMRLILRLKS